MRTLTKGLGHWKDGNFGGSYFFKSTVPSIPILSLDKY